MSVKHSTFTSMIPEAEINQEIELLFSQRGISQQLGINRKTFSSYKEYYRQNTLSLGKKLELLNLTGRLQWYVAPAVEDEQPLDDLLTEQETTPAPAP
jgi:hypothetical protein